MQNIYLVDPYLECIDTEIVAARADSSGAIAVSLAQTVIRPAGGGQPADRGFVAVNDNIFDVTDIAKSDGKSWLTLEAGSPADTVGLIGLPVQCSIDIERRRGLTQCHTLTHVLMASIRRYVGGYASCGADIEEDARTCRLWFASSDDDPSAKLANIDMFARSVIHQDRVINITNVKSPEHAARLYPYWRVDPTLALSGKIRVVDIPDLDCNPCSGTHCRTTSEIGPYSLNEIRWRADKDCFELLATRETAWLYWYGG